MTFPTATSHHNNCEWHHDQYPWECTCGAIANPNKFKPQWLKASVEPDQRASRVKRK